MAARIGEGKDPVAASNLPAPQPPVLTCSPLPREPSPIVGADPDLLLVVDNFEHLLPDGAAVLDQLLEGVTRLRCIVTSREALSAGQTELSRRSP